MELFCQLQLPVGCQRKDGDLTTMLACNPCAVSNGRPPPPPSFPPLQNFFSSLQSGGQNTFARGEKRKKENNGSDIQTSEKRRAIEEKITSNVDSSFAAKVKHLLPTSVVANNNNRSSYSRMWKRRRKVSDDSLLNDIPKTNDVLKANDASQKFLPEAETEKSAKHKLLSIVQNDRMSTQADEIQVLEDDKEPKSAAVKPKASSGGFFLQRGNNLISSVRSSLRKMGYTPHKRRSNDVANDAADDAVNVDVVEELTCLKLEDGSSNDSQVIY